MEVKIDSPNPQLVPGEILTRGLNVMLGYYKNEEATRQALDDDGWYHTGDLGTMDEYGNVFIKGRSKNMILGPSGQNIYPEEIEDKLNSLPCVVESVVVDRDHKLYEVVYPDTSADGKKLLAEGQTLEQLMDENLKALNAVMPVYSKVTAIELVDKEFEKTPKRSIKRFMYK
jgi:long-chain acyl-CoA synthetase